MTRPSAQRCTICSDQRSGRLGAWRCRCGNVRLVSGFYVATAGDHTIEPIYRAPSHAPEGAFE